MTRRLRMRYFALHVLVFLSLTGWAAGGDMAGRIEKLDGEGRVQRGQTVIPAGTGLELYAEDVVFTEEWSSIGIVLQDGSILFLGPDSRLLIRDFLPAKPDSLGASGIGLLKGFLTLISGLVPEKARTETPDAVIAILNEPRPDEEPYACGNTGRPAAAEGWRGYPRGQGRTAP